MCIEKLYSYFKTRLGIGFILILCAKKSILLVWQLLVDSLVAVWFVMAFWCVAKILFIHPYLPKDEKDGNAAEKLVSVQIV